MFEPLGAHQSGTGIAGLAVEGEKRIPPGTCPRDLLSFRGMSVSATNLWVMPAKEKR